MPDQSNYPAQGVPAEDTSGQRQKTGNLLDGFPLEGVAKVLEGIANAKPEDWPEEVEQRQVEQRQVELASTGPFSGGSFRPVNECVDAERLREVVVKRTVQLDAAEFVALMRELVELRAERDQLLADCHIMARKVARLRRVSRIGVGEFTPHDAAEVDNDLRVRAAKASGQAVQP